jgi:hypothetical protein
MKSDPTVGNQFDNQYIQSLCALFAIMVLIGIFQCWDLAQRRCLEDPANAIHSMRYQPR